MTLPHLAAVSLMALVSAVVVGLIAFVALRLLSKSSILLQLCVIVLAAVLSIASGMWMAASAMFVNADDLTVFTFIAAVAGVVSIALAVLLGRAFVRNSQALIAATRRIGTAEPAAGTGRQSNNEFAALAEELTATNWRLAESTAREKRVEKSRRELMAWISHDLRTPLAGLRAMTEALQDGVVADPAVYYQRMSNQIASLSGMVDDLNELSRIHAGSLTLSMESVSLYDLVSDTVAELGPVAQSRSITLTGEGAPELVVRGDPRELSRVVGNLVMNAIQHSPPGSPILVSASDGPDGHAVVSVIDAGGGIPEKDLDRVFDAGWRASDARTPEPSGTRTAGAGFGLAIVQGIVQAHRGRVSVQNIPGGCRFDVYLPRPEAQTLTAS